MREIWKAITESKDLYEISNLGRVRRTSGLTKLSLKNFKEAKRLKKLGWTYKDLGKKFGVGAPSIFEALNYKIKGKSRRIPNRIRKVALGNSGYNNINLCYNGVTHYHRVSKLVANAFIGPKPERMYIDHINRKRNDDRAINLRYVSHPYNIKRRVIICPWCKGKLHFNGEPAKHFNHF